MNQEATKQFNNFVDTMTPKVTKNKNAYEVRLEMLKLAKDFSVFKFNSEFDQFKTFFDIDEDGVPVLRQEFPEEWNLPEVPEVPKLPTFNEMMDMAEAMKKFVDDAGPNGK